MDISLDSSPYAFMDKKAVSMKLKRYGINISTTQREVNWINPVLATGSIDFV